MSCTSLIWPDLFGAQFWVYRHISNTFFVLDIVQMHQITLLLPCYLTPPEPTVMHMLRLNVRWFRWQAYHQSLHWSLFHFIRCRVYLASHWFCLRQFNFVFRQMRYLGTSVKISRYSTNKDFTSLICSGLNSGFTATSATLSFCLTLYKCIKSLSFTTAVLSDSSPSSSSTQAIAAALWFVY